MKVGVGDVTWQVLPVPMGKMKELFGETYAAEVSSFKKHMAEYFSRGDGCRSKVGKSISPVGASGRGGKLLKVRWGYPGCGKSGGLRVAVVAYCDERRVVIAEAIPRKDDPDDVDISDAGAAADKYVGRA